MIVHFASVIAGVAFTLWSTVITQYHEFRDPDYTPPTAPVVKTEEVTPTITTPTPFETVVNTIVRTSSTTGNAGTSTLPPRTPISVPPVPFTPLPIPTQPVITTPSIPAATPTVPSVVTEVEQNRTDEALLKASIVNIICVQGGGLRGVSGSGVVIDPRGIILTVAHVGQNFLLTDYPEENTGQCYIRTGSPAKNTYLAELVYISAEWINDNETTFLEARPKGTGENDYAFLAVTGAVNGASVPRTFSYIPMSAPGVDIDTDDMVGVGSYGAEFLTSSQVRSALYPTISFAPVNDVFTFDRSTEDEISVRAGAAAQEGSSGGAVMNEDQHLIGLITTRTVRADLSLRDLQAITMDHIRRSFREDMRSDLDFYLKNNSTASLVTKFENRRTELLQVLVDALERVRN